MGRKPSRWTNLPRGMRARPRGKLIHYYLDTGEKPRREIPLGSDYVAAVAKWAELTKAAIPAAGEGTFPFLVKGYRKDILPGKAARTQKDNEDELVWLLRFFGDPPAPLSSIEPGTIKQYMRWRCDQAREAAGKKNDERIKAGRKPLPINPKLGQVRANREKALFSHIWNYGREEGLTKLPNPCAGLKGFEEGGRDVYVDDPLMASVMEHAVKPLEFALRLAHLTGQRPADVRKMSRTDIRDGYLHVKQGKAGAMLRIAIVGELATLLDEIKAFKDGFKSVHTLQLLVNEDGKPLTENVLRNRFDDAREAAGIDKNSFQFRDLRAKAATEADDAAGGIKHAQSLLGHTTETMTNHYVRSKLGKKVQPLR